MFHAGGGGWWTFMSADEKQRPEISRPLLRRVAGYARPYLAQIVFVLAAIGLTTLLGLVPPLLYRQLIDHVLPAGDVAQLNTLALAMIGIPVVSGLIGVAQRYTSAKMGEGLICDLRQALYAHMQRMSLRFFTHTKTGEIMARLNNDVVGAQRAITGTLIGIITNLINVVFTLAIMLSLEWRLTLLGVTILPLFILPSRRVARVLRDITRQQMDLNGQMSAQMNETLNVSGALLMKLFGRQPENFKKFRERSEAVRDIGVRSAVVGQWFFLGLGLVSAVGTALVFWIGGHLVFQGVFTVGTIVAFAAYLIQLYGPISGLVNARVDFATSMVSFERVFEVIDLPVEIDDRPGGMVVRDVRGRVRFENVSFSYLEIDPAARPVLGGESAVDAEGGDALLIEGGALRAAARQAPRLKSTERFGMGMWRMMGTGPSGPDYEPVSARQMAISDVSFEIAPGQLAALVGPSGAGKTTITYLLPRLYDPTAGRITIDGRDLRDVTLATLSNAMGMVTQETYLFHDTIRANLLYAKPDATQAELEAACTVANIYDFIKSLPEGFETIVGERGYRLSGGEKQRVAIARVILKDPRVLILDEATSSLDSQSEALIQEALKPLFRGRTSLVIAHRLSTILAADVILVMNEGKLVERGTHAELLARGGLYATLYNTQFRRHETPATRSDPLHVATGMVPQDLRQT
ncbi:MAG TPA: ABC transporter ATP-binding protein [Anaerolineae bacterium]|nr:ABC transporter ATP-binding protein [Anaerolineae bacterium]